MHERTKTNYNGRYAKAIKTYANQKTEEMIQLITQMNNEMQNERQEMQDERQEMQDERQKMQDERQKMQDEIQEMQNKLIKEEGRSAGLQSAVHMLKEEIRSTPTYASVTKRYNALHATHRRNTFSLYRVTTKIRHQKK